MHRLLSRLGPIAVVLVFGGAAYLLHHELSQYHLADIRQAIEGISPTRLLASLALTVLNYLVLVGYDYLAVRAIGQQLPLRRVALASFTGFVTSYNLGAVLGGTPVRIRLYSAWGLSPVEVLRLILMLGVTFWVGVFALAGVVFLLEPFPIPADLHLPFDSVWPIGWALVALAVAYQALSVVRRKPLRLRHWEFQLPAPGMSLAQMAVAAADLIIAAGCLYVLVGDQITLGYPEFLGVYLLAVVVVLCTHVPGGVGVFELVVLTLAAPHTSPALVAALLAFRVIYYLLPMLVATVLLIANELALRPTMVRQAWSKTDSWTSAGTPVLLSLLTFWAGGLLLFSGVLPPEEARLTVAAGRTGLPILELSHFLSSLIGAGLMLLTRPLQLRLQLAWRWSAILLGLGIACSLARDLQVGSAIALGVVLLLVLAGRQSFHRRGSLWQGRLLPAWTIGVAVVVAGSIWFGWFVHRHPDYGSELGWQFAADGHASRVLRAGISALALVVLYGLTCCCHTIYRRVRKSKA